MKLAKLLIITVCLIGHFAATAQKQGLLRDIDSLKTLLSHADSLSWQQLAEEASDVNCMIEKQLVKVLSNPTMRDRGLDSLLVPVISVCQSKDQRLSLYSWFENTGGTFQSHITVVQYRTRDGIPKTVQRNCSYEDEGVNNFPSYGGTFSAIYKLPHATRQLYLCIGWVKGCSSCCGDIATVVELTSTGIDFSYPAFTTGTDLKERTSHIVMESRCGNMEAFVFDPKKLTISYTYATDDNTEIKVEEASRVTGILRWNGKSFTKKELLEK